MASRVSLIRSSSTRFCRPWPQHERYLEATCECSLRGGGRATTKMPRRKLQKFLVAGHHVRYQSRRKSIPRTKPLQQFQAVRKRALCRCRQMRIPVGLLRLGEGCEQFAALNIDSRMQKRLTVDHSNPQDTKVPRRLPTMNATYTRLQKFPSVGRVLRHPTGPWNQPL